MEAGTSARIVLFLLGVIEATIGGVLVAGGVLAIVYLSWLHIVGHGVWGGILVGALGFIVINAVVLKKSILFLVHTVFGTVLLLLIFPAITVLWALELDVDAWSSNDDPDWCRNGCDDEAHGNNPYYNVSSIAEVFNNSLPIHGGGSFGGWDRFRQAYLEMRFWPERLGQNIFSALNNEVSYMIHGEIPCDSVFWKENCHKNASAWLVSLLCLCLAAFGAAVVFISVCMSCCIYAQCFGHHHSTSVMTRRTYSIFHSRHSPSVSPVPTAEAWPSSTTGAVQPHHYEHFASH